MTVGASNDAFLNLSQNRLPRVALSYERGDVRPFLATDMIELQNNRIAFGTIGATASAQVFHQPSAVSGNVGATTRSVLLTVFRVVLLPALRLTALADRLQVVGPTFVCVELVGGSRPLASAASLGHALNLASIGDCRK